MNLDLGSFFFLAHSIYFSCTLRNTNGQHGTPRDTKGQVWTKGDNTGQAGTSGDTEGQTPNNK